MVTDKCFNNSAHLDYSRKNEEYIQIWRYVKKYY